VLLSLAVQAMHFATRAELLHFESVLVVAAALL
jgi:hypothetical protein